MLARTNSVWLPALSRSDRGALAVLLVARVDCAVLYCIALAVLAVRGGGSSYPATTLVYTRTSHVQKKIREKRCIKRRRLFF